MPNLTAPPPKKNKYKKFQCCFYNDFHRELTMNFLTFSLLHNRKKTELPDSILSHKKTLLLMKKRCQENARIEDESLVRSELLLGVGVGAKEAP